MSEKKYFYTKDHEWINIDGNIATIGITDFAQKELGDIIFIELPQVGDSFTKGDVFGTIEAVKTVADLFMPISGRITELNSLIEDNPELVNKDAFNNGWIVKINLNNKAEISDLLTQNEYLNIINE